MIGITFLFFIPTVSKAQLIDSVRHDSTIAILHVQKHSPKKAAWMSAACPGLGQIYNKKYWKLPIIYVATGALVYSFQFNQSRFVKYRTAYKNSLENTYTGPLDQDQLAGYYKYYHHYRDLTVIGFAAVYLLNIIDASVDAHLFNFDVSDDLSLNVHPALINTSGINHYTTGLSFNIKF